MNALFFGDGTVATPVRMQVPAAELVRRGYPVLMLTRGEDNPEQGIRASRKVVFQRPIYGVPPLIKAIHDLGKEVILDIDDDFLAIDPIEESYKYVGFGNPDAIQSLLGSMGVADLTVLSTPELERRYGQYCQKTQVIPAYWDDANPAWRMRRASRWFRLGWCGSATHMNDVRPLVAILERVAHEHPQVKLVIGGDSRVYDMLHSTPEPQKMFIPPLPFDHYPLMLCQMDLLAIPLRETFFNWAKSDIKLLDASGVGIPWVATDCPPYRESANKGGILVSSFGQWYDALTEMVENKVRYLELAALSRASGQERKVSCMTEWERLIL